MARVLDKRAFEEIYSGYYLRLVSFAYNLLQDREVAKDLVQDSFVRFWEKYHSKELADNAPVGIVFVIVRNSCLDFLRKKSAEHRIILSTSDAEELLFASSVLHSSPAEYLTISKELSREISLAYKALPEKCSEVFRLSREEELSNAEISSRLGISVKAVEKHITKALKFFKKSLNRR